MSIFYRGTAPDGPGPLARPATVAEMFPHAEAQDDDLRLLNEELTLWQGTVILPGDIARIDVPPGQYFLDGTDTDRLNELVQGEIWEGTLGSLSPTSYPPAYVGGWNLDLSWLERGNVDLTAARKLDPDALLAAEHARISAAAATGAAGGEPDHTLLGWAILPRFDAARRVLSWATEKMWSDEDGPVLSLNIHWFGRTGNIVGVLIADMDQIDEVTEALPGFIDMVHFAEGCRHEDFDPARDRACDVGPRALICGTD
ncbi:DUF2167 domain-containing protein [Paroceanicella profunda]|uniref:DUF2167 domain-containing protein n=1 Tax=Paroceanicella profunda TaxID=2579971 RepID=A0A5B8FZU9_9RHOB|nr:DUF2167 domain-containing protein [Paroceanicella profunda]QDL91753.1 DUF2167 domain-containing protein [Paroceanicella profunda]